MNAILNHISMSRIPIMVVGCVALAAPLHLPATPDSTALSAWPDSLRAPTCVAVDVVDNLSLAEPITSEALS